MEAESTILSTYVWCNQQLIELRTIIIMGSLMSSWSLTIHIPICPYLKSIHYTHTMGCCHGYSLRGSAWLRREAVCTLCSVHVERSECRGRSWNERLEGESTWCLIGICIWSEYNISAKHENVCYIASSSVLCTHVLMHVTMKISSPYLLCLYITFDW